jgi:hypothetical protein
MKTRVHFFPTPGAATLIFNKPHIIHMCAYTFINLGMFMYLSYNILTYYMKLFYEPNVLIYYYSTITILYKISIIIYSLYILAYLTYILH